MEPNRSLGKLLIFSAPSGAGKTTIVRRMMGLFPCLAFSVSATSRPPRGGERDGVDYYFFSSDEFAAAVAHGEFVEWEEVYPGICYGTLRREVDRLAAEGRTILFDVDVKGGVRLKEIFGEAALSIFVKPPSLDALRERLVGRGTDSPEAIARRLAKAGEELVFADRFDRIVLNDDLETAVEVTAALINGFIEAPCKP